MNKITKTISLLWAALLSCAALTMTSCSDGKSYADLLSDETKAVNYFLANQRVINEIPADSIFETGEDAPYYRMDEDGQIYMQVVKAGSADNKAFSDQMIYFRFMRYDLAYYHQYGEWPEGEGNAADMEYNPMYFRFGNYSLQSSAQYGSGIQLPLSYLGIDCEVNIVIKSQYGFTSEMTNVVPYLYNVRYFKSQI